VAILYLAIGLSYVALGALMALLYVYGFRRRFSGSFWGAAMVAVIGAFLGGLVDFIFADLISTLSSINGVLNIFPPIITAAILLSVFARLSERDDEYD